MAMAQLCELRKREKKPNQKFSGSVFLDGALLRFFFLPEFGTVSMTEAKMIHMFYNSSAHCEYEISLSMSLLPSLCTLSLYFLLFFIKVLQPQLRNWISFC